MELRILRRPSLLAALLLGLASLASVRSQGADPEWNAPVPQWRNGPVRYLLTGPEDRAYRKLETEAARAAFIDAFWKRRDPDPATPRNEFLEQFADRVSRTRSLRMYLESTKPMWLTDPGKYYILFGPPTSEDRSQVDTSTRDTLIWTWDAVPGVQQHHFAIAFVADESGEFRISGAPAYDQATTQGLASPTPAHLLGPFQGGGLGGLLQGAAAGGPANVAALRTALGLAGLEVLWSDPVLEAAGVPGSISELTRMVDLLRAESAPDDKATAEVRATPSFDPIPVQLRTDFYRASDRTTYATFTLGAGPAMESSEAARLLPFGGVVSLDDPVVTYTLDRTDQFAAAVPEAPGTFQTGLGVDPGRYRVLFGLRDPESGRTGLWREDLTVPDLSGPGLSISTLTLARTLRPLEESERPDSSLKVPFVFGRLRVVPRTGDELRNGEEFNVFYQVYGAAPGPAGVPVLDITYRFEGQAGDRWEAIGDPIEQNGQSGQVQAWSFPLQGWPQGVFRMSVRVTAREQGRSADASLQFVVVE